MLQIDGGGSFLLMHRQHCKHAFDPASASQLMSGHGLGGTDDHLVRMGTESRFDGVGFIDVAQGRGCAVCVQVIHLVW